jgi:regulator of replication initiation timing
MGEHRDSDIANRGYQSLDSDYNEEDEKERRQLIEQVFELQNTLDDLSRRVDAVKEENLKLKSENLVLGQYIENLMEASAIFQSTVPQAKKSGHKKGSH